MEKSIVKVTIINRTTLEVFSKNFEDMTYEDAAFNFACYLKSIEAIRPKDEWEFD